MTHVSRWIAGGLAGAIFLLPQFASAQRQPNLSGDWELVEALVRGAGRDSTGGKSDAPRRTTSTTISGAAFNCGRGCTIEQKGQTLAIARAQLAGADPAAVPVVRLQVNGRPTRVVDSFNPPGELPVVARWQDGGIEMETRQWSVVRQRLTIEKNELIVVTTNERIGSETIFRYRKKS
jgi:hypothetical protein